MPYIVKTPLVIAKTPGGDRYVYQGGALPSDTDPEQLKGLLGGKDFAAQVEEGEPTSTGAAEDAGLTGEPPAGNASKSEWVAYAVAHGMSEDEAEGLTRDELRDHFE